MLRRLYIVPHVKIRIRMGQNDTMGYVCCEKCPYKQVVWDYFHIKKGYLLDLQTMHH